MGEPRPHRRKRPRVLIVNDEPSVADTLVTVLAHAGFETREAHDGHAARRAIEEFRPDLVVLARARAMLRRPLSEDEEGRLRFADVVLSEDTHEVWRAGTAIELTPTEFNLLRYFMLNPRRVLTKWQILDNVWSDDANPDPNVVERYVSYLRRKLDPLGPPLIRTVRLVGYALREPGR
jgi:DNA-binding response OmpR family regulator